MPEQQKNIFRILHANFEQLKLNYIHHKARYIKNKGVAISRQRTDKETGSVFHELSKYIPVYHGFYKPEDKPEEEKDVYLGFGLNKTFFLQPSVVNRYYDDPNYLQMVIEELQFENEFKNKRIKNIGFQLLQTKKKYEKKEGNDEDKKVKEPVIIQLPGKKTMFEGISLEYLMGLERK